MEHERNRRSGSHGSGSSIAHWLGAHTMGAVGASGARDGFALAIGGDPTTASADHVHSRLRNALGTPTSLFGTRMLSRRTGERSCLNGARLAIVLGVVLLVWRLGPTTTLAAAPDVREVTPAGITIDGSAGDWDEPAADFLANMFEAGKPEKDVLSRLYGRYDCSTETFYVFVRTIVGWNILPSNNDNYVKLGQTDKLVDGSSGSNGVPPDFAYVGATGWEAAFHLPPGSYTGDNGLNVHAQVVPETRAATSAVADRRLPVTIDCSTTPPTAPPTTAPTTPPTAPPTIAPTAPPTVPPSTPPSVPPSTPPSVPPSTPPSVPPSTPPSVPPSTPPSVPPSTPPRRLPRRAAHGAPHDRAHGGSFGVRRTNQRPLPSAAGGSPDHRPQGERPRNAGDVRR